MNPLTFGNNFSDSFSNILNNDVLDGNLLDSDILDGDILDNKTYVPCL